MPADASLHQATIAINIVSRETSNDAVEHFLVPGDYYRRSVAVYLPGMSMKRTAFHRCVEAYMHYSRENRALGPKHNSKGRHTEQALANYIEAYDPRKLSEALTVHDEQGAEVRVTPSWIVHEFADLAANRKNESAVRMAAMRMLMEVFEDVATVHKAVGEVDEMAEPVSRASKGSKTTGLKFGQYVMGA